MTAVLLALTGVLVWPGSAVHRLGSPRDWSRLRGLWRKRSEPSVAEFLRAFAEELRAGAPARLAFTRAHDASQGDLAPLAAGAAALGGDVADALLDDAGARRELTALSALWRVSEGSGAALVEAVENLIEAIGDAERHRREIAAQLAGPRATVKVLAVLPLVGMGLAWMMGTNSVAWLLGGPFGWLCLAVGIGLEVAGLKWVSAMVRSVQRCL